MSAEAAADAEAAAAAAGRVARTSRVPAGSQAARRELEHRKPSLQALQVCTRNSAAREKTLTRW